MVVAGIAKLRPAFLCGGRWPTVAAEAESATMPSGCATPAAATRGALVAKATSDTGVKQERCIFAEMFTVSRQVALGLEP
mmetsp:Transcript_9148/g.23922  ORF Transcript_9148/g.23922 Transcript_9148/m.23922 type:complete len:80 (+) Transcript_9148:1791-2030(+)